MRLGLGVHFVLLSGWLALSAQQPFTVAADVGRGRSRYVDGDRVLTLMSVLDEVPANASRYPSFHFIWGDPLRHAEGAFAMAASTVVQRLVSDYDIHEWYCPAEPGSCSPVSYLATASSADRDWQVERRELFPPVEQRADALRQCAAGAAGLLADLGGRVTQRQGVVLTVFTPNGFRDLPGQVAADVHAFALFGRTETGLLVRDAADRQPITYEIGTSTLCDALTAPISTRWGSSQRSFGNWGVVFWVVKPPAVPVPAPVPAPTPVPVVTPAPAPPAPPNPSFVERSPVPLPRPPVVQCSADLRICGLGQFSIPSGFVGRSTNVSFVNRTHTVSFRASIADEPVAVSLGWLREIERAWNVERRWAGGFQFRPHASMFASPLDQVYGEASERDGPALRELAGMFRNLQQATRGAADSSVGAVAAFVQSIPYELVPASLSAMGVFPPVVTLGRYNGDCDTKSLLAAVILRQLGFQTAILSNIGLQHAVLGVAIDTVDGRTMTAFEHEGRRYVMIEATAPRAVGDMRSSGLKPGDDPRRRGWKFAAVQ